MTHTPHDGLFKRTFIRVELARDELRAVLPAALVQALDWSSLRIEAGETIDDELRARYSDVLLSVGAGPGSGALLWVLLEHQSKEDPLMSLRLHGYMSRIWARYLEEHPGARRVPPIVPVVIQHDRRTSPSVHRLSELYDLPAALLEALRPILPELCYLLDDLCKTSEEELAARTSSPYLKLVYWALRSRGGPPLERVGIWAEALAKLDRGDAEALMRYLVQAGGERAAEVMKQASAASPIIKETYVTLQEQWINEGLAKGRAEGKAEGRAEGKAEVVLKLLQLRFGALPSGAAEQVRAGTEVELERWAERVLTAPSLEEVLAP